MSKPEGREVIFEYTQIGNSIRVTAVDSGTGTEVVFQAHINTSKTELKRIAISKLKYVLKKQESGG